MLCKEKHQQTTNPFLKTGPLRNIHTVLCAIHIQHILTISKLPIPQWTHNLSFLFMVLLQTQFCANT